MKKASEIAQDYCQNTWYKEFNFYPIQINDHELRIRIDSENGEDTVFTVFEKRIPNKSLDAKMVVTYRTIVGWWHGLTQLDLMSVSN